MSRERLPSGWGRKTLGELAIEGPRNGYSGKTSKNATGTPTLRLGATTSGSFVLSTSTTKRMDETVPEDSPFWLEPGDLLVQRSNTREYVGTAAIFDGPGRTFIYPDLMMRLRFKRPETAAWVWRYLNSPTGRMAVQRLAAGSAGSMPKISGAKLKTIVVPLPPLSEQRRVAAILDKADTLRAQRERSLALLDDLLRSAFEEMFGDPVENHQGWEQGTFRALVKGSMRNGLSPSSKGTRPGRVLTLSAVTGSRFMPTAAKDALFDRAPGQDQFAKPGLFLICRGNGNLGLVGTGKVVPSRSGTDGTLFPDTMIGADLDQDRVCPPFVEWFWKTAVVRSQLERGARTTSGIHKVNQTTLGSVRVLLPPMEIQRSFARLTEMVDAQRRRMLTSHQAAEALTSSLLDRAFRGEL